MSYPKQQLSSFVPAFEGLRGLAVLLVIFDHTTSSQPHGFHSFGPCGVSIFFVLSGYLISGILVKIQKPRWRHIPKFYTDRFVRLSPMLLAVSLWVAWRLYAEGQTIRHVARTVGRCLLYMENLNIWRKDSSPHLSQTWSLAVEEQFYLSWSVILPLIMACTVRKRTVIMACLISLSMYAQYRMSTVRGAFGGADPYKSLLGNYWRLLIGAVPRIIPLPDSMFTRKMAYIGLLSLIPIGACEVYIDDRFFQLRGPALVALFSAPLIILGSCGQGCRPLEWQWLRFIGRVSYGWYLWSNTIQVFDRSLWRRKFGLYSCSVAFLIATVLTLYYEDHIREFWKERKASTEHDSRAVMVDVECAETESLLPSCHNPIRTFDDFEETKA